MADTLKFGPEWLRALSDGNSLGTPPPSPGFGKYKLADYRYGREEMLALFNPNCKVPDELEGQTYVLVEKSQEPLALIPLSEEEQRLLSQSVNSMAVLRMFGRVAPPGVRGRGVGPERGRGRGLGRGRGEGSFLQRGISYEETGGGGYVRPNRTDGWEEVGSKRNYQNRFDETGVPRREFTRSVSSTDSWRGRDEEEEGDGDWRKAGSSKWGARGNWRDPSNRERGGFDSRPNGVQRGGRTYQRSRNSESWDEEGENLPEWSMPDSDDVEEPGTFDSSGAFVFNKLKGMVRGSGKGDHEENHDRRGAPGLKLNEDPTNSPQRHNSKEDKSDSELGYNVQNEEVETDAPVREEKDTVPHNYKDKNKPGKSKQQTSSQEVEPPNSKPEVSEKKRPSNLSTATTSDSRQHSAPNKKTTAELESNDVSSSAQKQKSAPSTTTETKTKSTKKSSSKKESQMEQEALDRLKEKAENMVLEAIDVEAEEEEEESSQEDENTKKWFYLDPQGDVQGPFTSSEMAEWFSAGYFTMNLKVKRGCDDRYSPLGELIKRWGRVPFLPGSAPPPLLNSPQRTASPDLAAQQQQDQIKLLQQQYVLQQHMMHQQMMLRHLQMQQVMTQLQENDDFKNLPPLHQQQLATQILLKQQAMLPVPGVQSDTKLSPRSPPTERVGGESPRQMSHTFHRSMSQPADLTKSPPQTEDGSIWGSINPAVQDLLSQGTGSVWDLDPKSVISAVDLEAQLEKARKETDERQKEEEEKLRSELFHRKQEELRLQKEEIQREKEKMEMERQKYLEMKQLEELRRKEEAEKQMREEEEMQRRKAEEERRQMEENIRRQKEEEQRRRREEEIRLQELHRQQAELRQQELQRQEMIRQQEIQRQQETQRQEEEEMEKQKHLEIQKRQDAQRQQELQHKQQEALRKLQQEQMAKMQDQLAKIQLPSHAQWASQQTSAMGASGVSNKTQSLLEIQEQEERERYEQESMQMQNKAEAQRQQMIALQQQQQQQKSWSSQVAPTQSNGKSLLEIQEEQSQQETEQKNERTQVQHSQNKNLTLGAASVWGGVTSPSHWASEGAWGNAVRAQTNVQQQNSGTSNGAGSLGFWDDAIISSKRAPAASSKNSSGQTNNAEFPALKGGQIIAPAPTVNTNSKPKPSKMKKEEEAVQKLFQGNISKGDDFTQWCERELRNMATSVDIPTFISFLKEVDSPYEVHDYVRSYLGETKAAIDFAKQFLEKRSQNRNKSRQQQHQPEDSIWGPAPARDFRQSQPSSQVNEFETQKAKGKKKKRMTKIDSSILGFTVHADPARKNIGEIDNINK